MMTIRELAAVASRAGRLSVDYIAEVLNMDPKKDPTPEQEDAYLTAVLMTVAYIDFYFEQQLPPSIVEKLPACRARIAAQLRDGVSQLQKEQTCPLPPTPTSPTP